MRGFNYKKAVQALNFFAKEDGGTINKMKSIKLIWLADRLHLRKYGRSITGDEYFALPNGPVPSATRDVLECNNFLDDIASDYASEYIIAHEKYNFKSTNEPNLKVFSETDIETLKLVFSKFGHLNHFELRNLSHEFPEWKRHESALSKQLSSRFPIDQSDFFININEDSGLFNESKENISITKQIFEENMHLLSVL